MSGDDSIEVAERSIVGSTRDWPPWWQWELELTPHLLKRMVDRGFTEVELREMLEKGRELRG